MIGVNHSSLLSFHPLLASDQAEGATAHGI
jgi:hypothetical protein